MNNIIAIDPGPAQSAWLIYNPLNQIINHAAIETNEKLRLVFHTTAFQQDAIVFEMVQCFGMPVGKSVFETVFWTGRFWESLERKPVTRHLLYRSEIKGWLCNSMRAKDSNIRQALIDRFGGTKEAAIGVKAKPGPLYGIKKDLWSALAIAIVYHEKYVKGATQ